VDGSKLEQSELNSSVIQIRNEPVDHTFINELQEVNRMLDNNKEEVIIRSPEEKKAPRLNEPDDRSRGQVFADIKRLDILSRTLMEHEGFLIKMSKRKKPRRVWCHIRDKKFKWYKDGPTKGQLSGTLDFDLYQCQPTVLEDG
jgi:hypothetical protein